MNDLENCVAKVILEEKGFHERGKKMVKRIHEQEIVFIEVTPKIYALDQIRYAGDETKKEKGYGK